MNPLFGGHRRPLVVAHRGASSAAPENTLAALAAAVHATESLGAIELDVQVSADGHAVLYHNEYLDKAGRPGQRVDDLGVAELTNLDVGSWHSPAFAGEQMPTLQRVLAEFLKQTPLFVELKMRGNLDEEPLLRCRRTDALLGELLGLGDLAAERLMVLCFDNQSLRLMHVQAPHLGYVLNIGGHLPAPSELADEIGHLSALCVNIKILEPDFVAFAHGRSLPVLTFTCNDPAQVDRAIACGVDAILTDDPAWLARHLETMPQRDLHTA